MHLETLIEFGDVLGGRDRVSLEMHLEDVIEPVWRCIWRPRSSELTDLLGGGDRASLVMHLEAVFEHIERSTWRPWSIKIGGVLGCCRSGVRRNRSWDSIHWLTRNCGNVESWVRQHWPRHEKLVRSGRLSIWGWCGTWWMLYSVLILDHGRER